MIHLVAASIIHLTIFLLFPVPLHFQKNQNFSIFQSEQNLILHFDYGYQ